MSSVAILLCTYNGARFLPAQLKSFADQTFTDWRLFVSDDGSTDTTVAVLSQQADKLGFARPDVRSGPRQGFVSNFLGLACDASITDDYFAYSDQDDVWEPFKLARAVEWLRTIPSGTPALYCSRTRLIDEADCECGLSPLFRRPPSFRNALVQSIAGGNTMVFNRAARELIMAGGAAVRVPSHDWWNYQLVTGAGGQVKYDPVPSVRYRVHPKNVIGSNAGWLNQASRLRMLAGGRFRQWNDQNIAALARFRSRMTPENRAVFDLFCESRERGLIGRQLGFFRTGIRRQTLVGNIGLLFAVWTKKI